VRGLGDMAPSCEFAREGMHDPLVVVFSTMFHRY
jgi:hypothetical protein